VQERTHQVDRERGPHHLGAEAEHVQIVVLDALVGRIDVMANRSADSDELAGGHGGSYAGSANEDSAVGVAVLQRLAELPRLVGVVDRLGIGIGAQVDRLVAQRVELGKNRLAQPHAAVIERDCNPHHFVTLPLMEGPELWRELGQQLRVDSVRCAAAAKSGHPSSGMSAADLMAVFLAKYYRYDFDEPKSPTNDRLVFSKGHASTLLYAMYRAAGVISEEELLTYRQFSSIFEGHPTPRIPWVDVATGSLGQGLPYGVGIALAGKKLDRTPMRTWVLLGDSEMAEGSQWEAFEHAAFYELDNLIAIIDVNRLGQRGETMHGWDLDSYANRARAFGWHAIEIDGHDVDAIDAAYTEALEQSRPTVVVARTIKGKGVKAVEDKPGWHGKALDKPDEAIEELGGARNIVVEVAKPDSAERPEPTRDEPDLPRYDVGDEVATRKAYGEALAALGTAREDVVGLDGEVSNSTFAEIFRNAVPDRYFEMYIAEQQMVAAAVGMQVTGWRPFASTFAAFLSRAYDFIRMSAISRANYCLSGSHAGVSIGEDGPSQMALEDIASIRAVHGSTVLHPCDANQTAKLVAKMADLEGIAYIRTLRPNTAVVYDADEEFEIGGSRTLRTGDDVALIGAGITVHEALEAAETLAQDGIEARVIDLYSIKPLDEQTIRSLTTPIVTVEDHFPEGGLGEAVLSALADAEDRPRVVQLAVREMPHSGKPDELLAAAGIDATHIAEAARQLVGAAVSA
jgi:transketolase